MALFFLLNQYSMPTLFLLSFNFFSSLYTVFTYHSSLYLYTRYEFILTSDFYPLFPMVLFFVFTRYYIPDTVLVFAKAFHYGYNYKKFI